MRLWIRELGLTLRLAGPIAAGNVGQLLIGVVDTLMIGRVGVAELGAVAFVNTLFLIPQVACMGLLASVPVLVSQAKGADQVRDVGRHIKRGMALALAVSALVTALLAANALWLDRYGQEPEVVAVSRNYYWLIVASLVPTLVYQCLKGASEGLGWSKPPMIALLSGVALNAVLNWLLIFGELGFPELGLEGAGWATLIARWAIGGAMVAFVLRSARFRPYLPRSWLRRYGWAGFRPLLRIGLPTAAQHLFEVGAFAGSAIIVGWISKEALAGHQVAITVASVAFMVPLGLSIATGIRAGEALGSRAYERLRAICFSSVAFSVVQTATVGLALLVFSRQIAEAFVADAVVAEIAASLLVVVALFQVVDGAQVASIGALRGISDVNVPMGIAFVAYWLVALPAAYGFGIAAGRGAAGVWIGLAVGLGFAALGLVARLAWATRAGRLAARAPGA